MPFTVVEEDPSPHSTRHVAPSPSNCALKKTAVPRGYQVPLIGEVILARIGAGAAIVVTGGSVVVTGGSVVVTSGSVVVTGGAVVAAAAVVVAAAVAVTTVVVGGAGRCRLGIA
jgi:hypothetical protein